MQHRVKHHLFSDPQECTQPGLCVVHSITSLSTIRLCLGPTSVYRTALHGGDSKEPLAEGPLCHWQRTTLVTGGAAGRTSLHIT